MSETNLARLTGCAMTRRFRKGETVLHEGDFANRFYLIEKGKVTLEAPIGLGETEVLDAIGPGDLVGWSWLFPPHVWHFTARAVKATTAIFFYGTILREYCENDHTLGYELFKRMSAVMIRPLQASWEQRLATRRATAPVLSRRARFPD